MSRLTKYSVVYLFSIFLFILSLSFVFAAEAQGACVDLSDYTCVAFTTNSTSSDSAYEYCDATANLFSFFENKACNINDGDIPDILDNNGCCCINSTKEGNPMYAALVNSQTTCEDAINVSSIAFTSSITDANTCNNHCAQDDLPFFDPNAPQTCTQRGGTYCLSDLITDESKIILG